MPEVNPNTPQQSTTTVVTKNTFNWKNVLLGVIFGVILIAVIAITFWYLTRPKESTSSPPTTKTATTSAKSSTPSATTDQTAGWKTYTNDQLKFSLKYPSNWVTEGLESSGDQGLRFRGPEGYIEIAWATQWGGGCPKGYEALQLKSKTVKACREIQSDGSEAWSQIVWSSGDSEFATVYADAIAYSPHETNRTVILKIFSTLEVP